MTNRKRIKLPILLIIFTTVAMIFSGCGDGTTFRLTDDDIDYLASSYLMLRGDEELPESRAAWNALSKPLEFPIEGETSTTSSNQNYPEKGQRTDVEITKTDTAGIFLVTNITTYPRKENILSSTTESYYVKDVGVTGTFNDADLLWDKTAGTDDFNKREVFETLYQNGTTRYEAVEATTMQDDTQYAAIDINGSLDYPDSDASPSADATANYSSRVRYIQDEGSTFSFWPANKIVIGARYYTEHGDNETRPTQTSIAYEKVIKTDTAATRDNIASFSDRLFADATGDITLAETVIRYEILPNGQKTVNSQTVIYNEAGTVVATLAASYLEDEDGKVTNPGRPAVSYP